MNDSISRQAAIDLLKRWSGGYSYIEYDTESAIHDFERLPSAQPYTEEEIQKMQDLEQAELEKAFELGKAEANRWIPCSERLPDIGQKVLASTRKSVFTQVFKGVWDGKYKKWIWEHNSLKTIEAWMPLPESYKENTDA